MKGVVNKTVVSLAFVALLIAQTAFGQPPQIEWSRAFGGDSSDEAFSVQQATDGGFVFAGYTKSFNADSNDVYWVKTDSLGNTQWCRLYGGPDYDAAYSLQQTADGGFIIAGRTSSFGAGGIDMYMLRINSFGDTLWTRTYGGTYIDYARSVMQVSDGGFILAGCTEPYIGGFIEMYLVKTDNVGDTLWTRSYGGTDDRMARCVRQTSDGGYILVGYNPLYGGDEYDIYLVKTDSLGDTLWTRSYGGSEEDYALSVRQTIDGGYIIAGGTYSFGAGYADFYVVKTDRVGDTLWTRTYGGSGNDFASSLQIAADGNYVITGNTASFGADDGDMYLIKISPSGDTLWTLVYGGPDSDVPQCIDLTNDGGYIITGSIFSWEWPANAWLVKTGPDTSATHAPSIEWVSHPRDFVLHPAYPNPFNPSTIISYYLPHSSEIQVDIYNLLGQRVVTLFNGRQDGGIHSVRWDASNSASGIYFVQLKGQNLTQTRKILLLK